MRRVAILGVGVCLLVCAGGAPTVVMAQQPVAPVEQPAAAGDLPPAMPVGAGPATGAAGAGAAEAEKPVQALTDGPVHEAFLSPAKDGEPVHVEKPPPAPIIERPGIDSPSARAEWIGGYWEWDPGRKDFVWVTGTWRNPPPGRFWVNGYWKRDDQGWYRVPGFWSDRRTDRIDYRKDGPPTEHPEDNPGESPGPDFFYVPGQYYPDGDGVVWKPGFWANVQPGWAWVPAQWVRQPEGWTFQEGYWDRTLEDRGTLFAPAQVAPGARGPDTVFQPYSQISPESYGLLYGAFGRPNAYYDGYPGNFYDPTGRYYGYAQYGTLVPYYGYLDYPYYGGLGYPYFAQPLTYGLAGYGGYGGLGFGGFGGLGLAGFGGWGFGFPYGGLGFGGFGGFGGYGLGFGLGFGGFGYPFFGGFGFPFFGFPAFAGFGFPLFGAFGFPLFAGFPFFAGNVFIGAPFFPHRGFPFHPGQNPVHGGVNRHVAMDPRHAGTANRNNAGAHPRSVVHQGAGARAGAGAHTAGNHGVRPPPSSSPFANPFHHASMTHNQGAGRTANHSAGGWNAGYNGVQHASAGHTAARPAFSGTGLQHGGLNGNGAGGLGGAAAIHHGIGATGANLGAGAGGTALHQGGGIPGAGSIPSLHRGPGTTGGMGAGLPSTHMGAINSSGLPSLSHIGGAGGYGGGGVPHYAGPALGGGGYGGLGGGFGGSAPRMAAPHYGGGYGGFGGGYGGGIHMGGGFGGGMGHAGGGFGGGHGGGGGGHR
jgi:hypothetical protein